jgi:predicted dehydrogenase
MQATRLGIIGCGSISDAYLTGAARSALVRVVAVADRLPEAAVAKAEAHGVEARAVDDLLADPSIEIVINLTVPLVHAEVSRRIIAAGKHVYSEKPLGVDYAEGRALADEAAAAGLRIGSAPDTFFGASHQAVRYAIDEGRIGRVVAGAACFATHGMEGWHPNPSFFFKRGGGPVLDIGPYPLAQLVNLLGPVERVAAIASRGSETRTVTSEPRHGEVIEVEVATTVNGALAFRRGANVAFTTSWDIWKHTRLPIEIYGTEGTILNPDPNFFGGAPRISEAGGEWQDMAIEAHPFGRPTRRNNAGLEVADYRMVGVLDMASAIREGRPHRASGELALHVLEIMDALDRSSREARHITLETICQRPAPVPKGDGEEVFSLDR